MQFCVIILIAVAFYTHEYSSAAMEGTWVGVRLMRVSKEFQDAPSPGHVGIGSFRGGFKLKTKSRKCQKLAQWRPNEERTEWKWNLISVYIIQLIKYFSHIHWPFGPKLGHTPVLLKQDSGINNILRRQRSQRRTENKLKLEYLHMKRNPPTRHEQRHSHSKLLAGEGFGFGWGRRVGLEFRFETKQH